MNASELIKNLQLTPHPEGGHFKETYRSNEGIPPSGLPSRFTGKRSFSTAIYYLLQNGERSVFHKIKSDECWHFYAGSTLYVHIIKMNGCYSRVNLGQNIAGGDAFQFVVPANVWFASEPAPTSDFSLVGCTVAPGFDFDDFEIARKNEMLQSFPQHEAIINKLCH